MFKYVFKFCENIALLLSYVVPVKSKMKISQNFVAFSEYVNFKYKIKVSYLRVVFPNAVHCATLQTRKNCRFFCIQIPLTGI